MNTNSRSTSATLAPAFAGVMLALGSAPLQADGPGEVDLGVIVPAGPIIPPNHVRDESGNPPATDDTALWRFCAPVTALCPAGGKVMLVTPDGSRQLTWGEWRAISATARTKCVEQATHITLHVSGAVPNAVYTAWLAFIGAGPAVAAGDALGTNNFFQTSAAGEGELSFFRPGDDSGPKMERCVLTAPETLHLVLAYHMDSQSHGPGPGDPSTQAFQAVGVLKEATP